MKEPLERHKARLSQLVTAQTGDARHLERILARWRNILASRRNDIQSLSRQIHYAENHCITDLDLDRKCGSSANGPHDSCATTHRG